MKKNILIIHGGGPTAVINASLYGAVIKAIESNKFGEVLGAIGGTQGVLDEKFINFEQIKKEKLKRLLKTPASAIGSSRTPLHDEDYKKMVNIFKKHKIQYVLFNGGNGSMHTCKKLSDIAKNENIYVVGIPKTMDNDIFGIDHAPGYGSAARYIAATTQEIACDVRSLPIHMCIIEAMGRNAGWISAASSLSNIKPDLIYFPERAFLMDDFLQTVKKLYDKQGYGVIVVSEGLVDENSLSIVPPVFSVGRSTYYGNVSSHLSNTIIKNLGIKARCEIPGLAGRASIAWQSKVDLEEALEVGKLAVEYALKENTGVMVSIKRKKSEKYVIEYEMLEINKDILKEKPLPDEFINKSGNGVNDEFIKWCNPLIGKPLPTFFDVNDFL